MDTSKTRILRFIYVLFVMFIYYIGNIFSQKIGIQSVNDEVFRGLKLWEASYYIIFFAALYFLFWKYSVMSKPGTIRLFVYFLLCMAFSFCLGCFIVTFFHIFSGIEKIGFQTVLYYSYRLSPWRVVSIPFLILIIKSGIHSIQTNQTDLIDRLKKSLLIFFVYAFSSPVSVAILHYFIGDRFKQLQNNVYIYYILLVLLIWQGQCITEIINGPNHNNHLRRIICHGTLIGLFSGYTAFIFYSVLYYNHLVPWNLFSFLDVPTYIIIPVLFTKTWLAGLISVMIAWCIQRGIIRLQNKQV